MDLPPSITSIPNVSALRQSLDYGDASLGRVRAFTIDFRGFTQIFTTSRGLKGSDIIDWRSEEHHEACCEVLHAWLEERGCGNIYWPHDRHHPNANKFQYLDDKKDIETILKQIIFKTNKTACTNRKAKNLRREPQEPNSGSVRVPGAKPIEIESLKDHYSSQPTNREHLYEADRCCPTDPHLISTPGENRKRLIFTFRMPNGHNARIENLSHDNALANVTAKEPPAEDVTRKRKTHPNTSGKRSATKRQKIGLIPQHGTDDSDSDNMDDSSDNDNTARSNNCTLNATNASTETVANSNFKTAPPPSGGMEPTMSTERAEDISNSALVLATSEFQEQDPPTEKVNRQQSAPTVTTEPVRVDQAYYVAATAHNGSIRYLSRKRLHAIRKGLDDKSLSVAEGYKLLYGT